MVKEAREIIAEYHVMKTPDGRRILIGEEAYQNAEELEKVIGIKFSINRNRFLFGSISFVSSIVCGLDITQRLYPYLSNPETIKIGPNILGIGGEFVACVALLCYAINSFLQVPIESRKNEQVELALQNPEEPI